MATRIFQSYPRRRGMALCAGLLLLLLLLGAAPAMAGPVAPEGGQSGTAVLVAEGRQLAPLLRPDQPQAAGTADARDGLFWAYDFDAHAYYRLRATLAHASDISRVYVEAGQRASPAAVAILATAFEDQIYPRLRNRFGHEPEPGVDGQRAITLLLLDIRDPFGRGRPPFTYYAGYFDPTNQVLQTQLDAHPELAGRKSNEMEMVYLDLSPTVPGSTAQLQTLAHEFSHLITWNHDPDEDTWLSEGLSELAIFVAGLGHPRDHVSAFLRAPGGSLVDWSGDPAAYGMSYLFMLYLYEQAELAAREGEVAAAWPRRLVEHPANGLTGLRDSLPVPRPLDLLFRDWALALQLDDSTLADGRYGFLGLALGEDSGGSSHFPALATQPRGHYPIEEARFQLLPWSVRAERWVDGPGPLDISLAPSGPVCGALVELPTYRRAAPGQARVRAACGGAELPALGWTVEDFRSGGAAPALGLVAVNPSGESVDVAVSALPPIGGQRWQRPLYLPLTLP